MQLLARDGLTDAQVIALLQADTLEVTPGLELLAADLSVVADLSDDIESGRVAHKLDQTIHGTCSLRLTRELAWGVDLVRPTMTLTAGGVSARFACGVYCLFTPSRTLGLDVTSYEVQGQDRLYLLNRQVGRDYAVPAGTTYRDGLLLAFADAGLTGVLIDGSAADNTLPVTRNWNLVPRSTDPDQTSSPVTWLRVINDLLRAINFRSVWCDESGRYRCQAYAPPSERPAEFAFDSDDERTIVGEERTSTQDVWAVPNRWVAICSNPPQDVIPDEANGLIQVRENLTDGPTSQDARGLVWPSVLTFEAATPAILADLIDRRVALDRAVTQQLEVTTGPFPAAGHADIYTLTDAELGGTFRVQSVAWEFDLSGSDVQHTWEVIG